jgi:hypothetical protein
MLFVPAPILPFVALWLALSDQISGAVIAGVFSLINTVLLAVLTVRVRRNRDDDDPPDS